MTGNAVIDLLISIVGVALMVALARMVFGVSQKPLDANTASERLLFDEPDFAPVEWLVDETIGAALARNRMGEFALLIAHGDGLVTRRFAALSAGIIYREGRLIIPRSDHTSREVGFALPQDKAQPWLS